MNDAMKNLENKIYEMRDCGKVTFKIENRTDTNNESVINLIDTFVSKLGFTGLGGSWIFINQSNAETLCQRILYKDLAYGHPMMNPEFAQEMAVEFINFFNP